MWAGCAGPVGTSRAQAQEPPPGSPSLSPFLKGEDSVQMKTLQPNKKRKKPVRASGGLLKQVQQEWPRLGNLLSNLRQRGLWFAFWKKNLVSLHLLLSICIVSHPNLLCTLLQQKTPLISLGCVCVFFFYKAPIDITQMIFLCTHTRKAQQITFLPEVRFLKKLGQCLLCKSALAR